MRKHLYIMFFVICMILSPLTFAAPGGGGGGHGLGMGHGHGHGISSVLPGGSTPPGLHKSGKYPYGLSKKGKTPHGWTKGKKRGWTNTRTDLVPVTTPVSRGVPVRED